MIDRRNDGLATKLKKNLECKELNTVDLDFLADIVIIETIERWTDETRTLRLRSPRTGKKYNPIVHVINAAAQLLKVDAEKFLKILNDPLLNLQGFKHRVTALLSPRVVRVKLFTYLINNSR
ncbi:hypothetical protein WN48_05599 [Eufriesea mexicana]|uniref:Uncharacterized protein n=1 Tax=Eufriesea mexicana TaxID=516756 RepID=A0A310SMB8_9HYME|nr:hypothetical protein WN48_05599 [Eufriesea mexicana]